VGGFESQRVSFNEVETLEAVDSIARVKQEAAGDVRKRVQKIDGQQLRSIGC
jgi:hypothetical protein